MTGPVRLVVAGRTFIEPAATTFAQDAAIGEVLGQTGRIVVGLAETSDQLEQQLQGLLMGPIVPRLLARALVDERDGQPAAPARKHQAFLAELAEREEFFNSVTGPTDKNAMVIAATELVKRFFGSGSAGSPTSPSSSGMSTTTEPTLPSGTTSPATAPGADSSTPSLVMTPAG